MLINVTDRLQVKNWFKIGKIGVGAVYCAIDFSFPDGDGFRYGNLHPWSNNPSDRQEVDGRSAVTR